MLTVRGQEADRVTGFEAGCDDYVTKPFSLRELVGRVKVGLRRANGRLPNRREYVWRHRGRSGSAHGVRGPVHAVDLTPKEFDILALLLRRAGEAITRDEFLDEVWGKDVHVTHRTVDTHMSSLRRKLEDDPDQPVHIIGVRGVGYRFESTSAKP